MASIWKTVTYVGNSARFLPLMRGTDAHIAAFSKINYRAAIVGGCVASDILIKRESRRNYHDGASHSEQMPSWKLGAALFGTAAVGKHQ